MPTNPTTPATEIRIAAPTPQEFADMRAALLDQIEDDELVGGWWRRVRDARRRNDWSSLKLLHAEAANRLDHARRKKGMQILRVLFRLLGVRL